ncbi:hypothetical protein BS47DRAFT_1346143 [Hydnum rufescens UP504]|uniref:Protein kinase domain-containing protein n=1 Tax=Hydnum rufescens UP504 TaxID=1448309 RepID=A0A9P6AV54_9AGAM|nr:hypothetical protein BS47DRAFT_1346143 [Hydnum rufescens UP504]
MIIGPLPPSFWTAKDFHDMTHATPAYTLANIWFLRVLLSSSRSSLQPFLTAKVLDATCFRLTHLYLIFRIELRTQKKDLRRDLWARCERLTHSCWWYIATALSCLDLFEPEFSINTRKDYLSFYIKLFPPNIANSSRKIRPSVSHVVFEDTFPEPLSAYATIFKGSWKSRPKRFKGEIDIWRRLGHDNVLPFFGHCVDDNGTMYMVSPWCQHGDINGYLFRVPKSDRETLVLQLLHGLEYLHASGVIHGDLRGANVLISDNHKILITDFGLSKYLDQSPTSTVNRGNIRWMAPELLEQEIPRGDLTPYTEATDIYSFAMTTIEIYTGSWPFPHLRHNVEAALPGQGRPGRPGADGISHCIDDTLWDIIQECWAEEPARRPSARDAMERLEAHLKGKPSIAM